MIQLLLTMLISYSPSTVTGAFSGSPGLTSPGDQGHAGSSDAVEIVSGWPVTVPTSTSYGPVCVALDDLTGDGDLEVIAASTDGNVYVWNYDASLEPGFPAYVGGMVQGKVAVADIDGDGDKEIITASRVTDMVTVLEHDGTTASGWPRAADIYVGFISPSIYDLDGDDTPEIILASGSQLYVWDAAGNYRSGFPVSLPLGEPVSATTAVGDFTGDGIPEMIVPMAYGQFYAVDRNGNVMDGFPVITDLYHSYAAFSIFDIDGDGVNEVATTAYHLGQMCFVYALEGDGSYVEEYPITIGMGGSTYCMVIPTDADQNGSIDFFTGSGWAPPSNFHGRYGDGTFLPGWPITPDAYLEGSAIALNLDPDDEMEVMIADNLNGAGHIHTYNHDATEVAGMQIPTLGPCHPNSPAAADIDGDGNIDLAFMTGQGEVTVWDLNVPFDPNPNWWPTMFHDNWNTCQYGFDPAGQQGVESDPQAGEILIMAANPASGSISAAVYGVPGESVTVEVFSLTGRLVDRIGSSMEGSPLQLEWEGLETGVYLLRAVSLSGASTVRRVTLLAR